MSEARAPVAETPGAPPVTDWTLRPFEGTRRSPLWVGAVLLLAFVGLTRLFRFAIMDDRDLGLWEEEYLWLDLLNGLLFSYVPTATFLLRRGRLRDLRDLRPVLECDDAEFERLEARATCVAPATLGWSGLAGAILGASLPLADPSF